MHTRQHVASTRRAAALIGAAALIPALALTGCSNEGQPNESTPAGFVATPAAAAEPTPSPTQAMDAKAVIDALAAAGLPLKNIAVQDEDSDPNDKLGRPGQYTSRASADVPGGDTSGDKYSIDRGLVVEVFATTDDADARAKFIQDSLRNMPILGTEYHYRPADGCVLVRLTGRVKPSEAKAFETAVAGL